MAKNGKQKKRIELTCVKCGWTKILTETQWYSHQLRVHGFKEFRNLGFRGSELPELPF